MSRFARGSQVKRLIYTAVFGDYDRVYPPVRREAGIDHVIVTDRAGMVVPGWTTMAVDGSGFPTHKAGNVHYRALMHRAAAGYDTSLYVDGNIRLLRETSPLFDEFERSGSAFGAYAHPKRSTVAEEARAVIELGKVEDAARVAKEVNSYLADGFPDDITLLQTGMLLKNHRSPELDFAMALWSSLFLKHQTRDQLSLPYVAWKTGLSVHLLDERRKNRFFALYPHNGKPGANRPYNHVVARSYDSLFHRFLLKLWRGRWWWLRLTRPVQAELRGSK
jgi:hypothetical protein